MNIDGHFLEKPIVELLQKHDFLTVPLITGVTNDEGGYLLANVSLNTYIQFHARSSCCVCYKANFICVFLKSFGGQNWTEGIDREHLEKIMSMFYPGVSRTLPHVTFRLCLIILLKCV